MAPASRISARLILVLLLCTAIAAAAGAVTITQSPSVIRKGEQIRVGIRDLRDGAAFSLLIEGRFGVRPGGPFSFETRRFAMPITLEQGQISAYTENTAWTGLSVKKGNTTVSLSKESENGIMSHTESYQVNAGTYDFLKLDGEALPGRDQVLSKLTLKGIKKGPDDSELSFTVDGIDAGSVRILITVNESLVLNREVTVGTPSTPSPTTPSGTGPGVQTFTSADRLVTLEAATAEYVGILRVDAPGAPEGWEVIAGPYTLSPPGIPLGSPGRLAIRVPEEVRKAHASSVLSLARYRNGAWEVIPSSQDGDAVVAGITESGTYAVVARIPGIATPTAAQPWRLGLETSFLVAAGAIGAAALLRDRGRGRRGA